MSPPSIPSTFLVISQIPNESTSTQSTLRSFPRRPIGQNPSLPQPSSHPPPSLPLNSRHPSIFKVHPSGPLAGICQIPLLPPRVQPSYFPHQQNPKKEKKEPTVRSLLVDVVLPIALRKIKTREIRILVDRIRTFPRREEEGGGGTYMETSVFLDPR
jgi:hypothetical protein